MAGQGCWHLYTPHTCSPPKHASCGACPKSRVLQQWNLRIFIQKTWKPQVSVLWGHQLPYPWVPDGTSTNTAPSAMSSHSLSHKRVKFGILYTKLFGILPVPRAGGCTVKLPAEIKSCGIGVLAMGAAATCTWRNPLVSKSNLPQQLPHSPENFITAVKAPKDVRAGGEREQRRKEERKKMRRRGSSTLGCHHLSLPWGERTYF